MARATRYQVDEWLQKAPEVDFPATKADVLAALGRADAPDTIVEALRAIAPERYDRRSDMVAAAATEPDEGRDPSVQAAQQRVDSRVAEAERDVPLPPLHDER